MIPPVKCQSSKEGNRTVLVTGGAVRIGAAISEALAQAGWNVVVHAWRSRAEAKALCERLRAFGVGAWDVGGDLSQLTAGIEVFDAACEAAGDIDAVVNNAAVFSLRSEAEMTEEEQQALWQVNTVTPIMLLSNLHLHLRNRRAHGSVVHILDQRIAGELPGKATFYEMSKRALAISMDNAADMAPFVRVNAVAPGAVLLPVAPDAREPAGKFPLGFRPTPAQVADAVRWLLEAEAVTGQTLFVDGGQHLLKK